MNISICDEDYCLLCCMHGYCCSCEFSDSFWSKSSSQASFCTPDPREKSAFFGPAFCTIDGNDFFGLPFEYTDVGTDDDVIPCFGPRAQQPCAASTPKNNSDPEQWPSPGTMPPPESSSPIDPDTHTPPFSTEPVLPTCPRRPALDRCVVCGWCDNSPLHVKALPMDRADSNTFVFPTTMSLTAASDPMPASQSSPDDPVDTIEKRPPAVNPHDICSATAELAVDKPNIDRGCMPRCLIPVSGKRAAFPGPTLLDFAMSAEPTRASSRGTKNGGPRDATTANRVPSKIPPRKVSATRVHATLENGLKRRRSSGRPLESKKKVKLDQAASHVSCASDTSATSKYQATEPASMRRAASLKSDISISACSQQSTTTDSLFYPSPLSSLTSRPCLDNDNVPTAPSTPLPNSVDYARSKANPLVRTLVVYHRRSQEVPAIPPVPIIAPPPHIEPTIVRCAEDQAIDRLNALLLRERSERERDGLREGDEKREERLKAMCPVLLRRDSSSTADSSEEDYSQPTVESTCSATESQESRDGSLSAKILPEQLRLANRQCWSTAFGITSEIRKEITEWILEKRAKEPACDVVTRHGRPRGIDLHDQLTNSRQTRFHAAQLFHRYFIRPEKAQHWKRPCERDRLERSCDDADYEKGVWDIAVACVALSVKLHRDCLAPLEPVFAAEFLEMAPHSMVHETFELAQRDVFSTFQFQLGNCTPQDVLDELWNALPTLRRATAPIGWTVVQCATWDKLFASLHEPDMLQYPTTLLTAAALVDSLALALASHYRTEAEANTCKCKTPSKISVFERDLEPTSWQICLYEAEGLVDDVILDVRDVLHFSPIELDECRKWLSLVGAE